MKSARIEAIRQRRRDRAFMAQLRAETMQPGPLVAMPQPITPKHLYAALAMHAAMVAPGSGHILKAAAERDGSTVPDTIAKAAHGMATTMLEAGK